MFMFDFALFYYGSSCVVTRECLIALSVVTSKSMENNTVFTAFGVALMHGLL